MNRLQDPILTPRAIQNARTRIFVPGSDPRFGTRQNLPSRSRFTSSFPVPATAQPTSWLLAPGFLDRVQSSLTRYPE